MNISLLQATESLDNRVFYAVGRLAGNPTLCALARLEEGNYLLRGALFFAFFWQYWFGEASDQHRKRPIIVSTLLGSIVAIAVARTIAFLVPFRLRPMDNPLLIHPVYADRMVFNLEHWNSFPSDTAAYFFALSLGIWFLSRRTGLMFFAYTGIWICFTRIFIGVHYLSDIVAGVLIGLGAGWLVLKSKWISIHISQPIVAFMETDNRWSNGVAFLVAFQMACVFADVRMVGKVVLHGTAEALHLKVLRNDLGRPIDSWAGLILLMALIISSSYLWTKMRQITRSRRK